MKIKKDTVKVYLAWVLMFVAVGLGLNWEIQNRRHQKRMEMGARTHEVFLLLKRAVSEGDVVAYESLGDEPCRSYVSNEALLEEAIRTSQVEMVRRVLRDGIAEGHLVAEKVRGRASSGSGFYVSSFMGFTEDPILLAASIGEIETLKALKEAGAGFHTRVMSVPSYGRELRGHPPLETRVTPAGKALQNGHHEAAEWLVKNGSPNPGRV